MEILLSARNGKPNKNGFKHVRSDIQDNLLESNDLPETALSFLTEIKRKYQQELDLNGTHARTLILRPLYDNAEKDVTAEDSASDKLVVNIPGDERAKNFVPLHETKRRTVIFKSTPTVIKSESSNCLGHVPNLYCPDCQFLKKAQEDFQRFVKQNFPEDARSSEWHEMRKLADQINDLREKHVTFINLATKLKSAILSMKPERREHILGKYQQQLYDIYSYPGNHQSMEMLMMMADNNTEDKTDYQIESSVINSSKANSYNDLFIPLESKQVVGDIPTLIANNKTHMFEANTLTMTSKCFDSASTVHEIDNLLLPSESQMSHVHKCPNITEESAFRVNKSATLPVLRVAEPEVHAKSRSASFLDNQRLSANKMEPNGGFEHPKMLEKLTSLGKMRDLDHMKFISEHPTEVTQARTRSKLLASKSKSDENFLAGRHSVICNFTEIAADKQNSLCESGTATPPLSNAEEIQEVEAVQHVQIEKKKDLDIKPPPPPPAPNKEKKILKGGKAPQENKDGVKTKAKQNGAGNAPKPKEKVVHFSSKEIVNKPPELPPPPPPPPQRNVQICVTNDLDWVLLKKSLFENDANTKLKLLQALRWRLTRTDKLERDKNLLDYVKHDILSINTIPPYGQQFLENFYCPKKTTTPHPLQEEMARFINTLASLAMGRLYLERDENVLSVMLLPLLMGKLPGVGIHDLTREYTMATVQKMSLSNKMREVIITAGAVEWLVTFVEKNHARLSTYEAEYSIALLTNLCINKEARNRCERIADRVVSIILDLIETPHKCCVHYINPILYSLLLNPLINEKAVARGISVKLKDLYTVFNDDEELKRQLEAIIAMHETHDYCECEDCETEDLNSENYADFLEPELNKLEPDFGTPNGEELLKVFYVSTQPINQTPPTKSELIKRLSTVQIVKKNCVCNNKSISQIEHKLLEEPKGCVQRPTRRQKPVQQREKSINRSIPDKNPRIPPPKVVKNDKINNNIPKKPAIRRRSLSQPPAITNTNRKLTPAAATRRKIDSPPPKVKQFIVNCCYKMDYTKAMEAAPGEFIPQALDRPEGPSQRPTCMCYNQMKNFVENRPAAKNAPILQMQSFPTLQNDVTRDADVLVKTHSGKLRNARLQLTDFHVITPVELNKIARSKTGTLLNTFEPKIKR